jgi:AcrR family transcriptional regulator
MSRGKTNGVGPATRERILFEAADLFAHQGYIGTTTREIALAVGIRQPSLFHHFPSKSAIADALLEWDLGRSLPRVRAICAADEPAPVRLYRYLLSDVRHLTSAPYNLSGIYAEEVIGRDEFAGWSARREELHDHVEAVVSEGVASGEFVPVDTHLVREAISGILVRALTVHSGGRGATDRIAEEVARLVVRGLLADPGRLESVAAAANGS